jgi:hypothetical protein
LATRQVARIARLPIAHHQANARPGRSTFDRRSGQITASRARGVHGKLIQNQSRAIDSRTASWEMSRAPVFWANSSHQTRAAVGCWSRTGTGHASASIPKIARPRGRQFAQDRHSHQQEDDGPLGQEPEPEP